MMRDPVSTIGNLIDKQSTAYLGSVDGEGFPNVKAMLAPDVYKRQVPGCIPRLIRFSETVRLWNTPKPRRF